MKRNFILFICLLTLASCNQNIGSASSSINSTNSSSTSSSSSNSTSSDKPSVNVDDKMYYKSLVERENIKYSTPLVNDPNHDIDNLEIFQLNDTHGAYYDEKDIVGISRVKTCIEENTIDPYATVKIANGDMLQGTAFSNMLLGEPAIASLNEMNFDCFVIGNHEFDWIIDTLGIYKDNNPSNGELNCPFLGANIVDKDGNHPDFLQPYTVVEKGNVKVGIIGIIGDGLESSISNLSLNGYHFTDTVDIVNKYSKILKEEELVDVIILASHAHDEDKNQQYVDKNDIDCIINGHDHYRVEETVKRHDNLTIPVIESNTKNGSMGKVTLKLNENNKMTSYEIKHLYPEDYDEDTNLKNIIEEYHKVTQKYQDSVIAHTNSYLSKQDIAILTCNYFSKKYDVDLVFVNQSGVRANISSGDITNGQVYEVFPFDNEMYITSIKGSDITKMISSKNMSQYYYNNNKPIAKGNSFDSSIISSDTIYKVATVDYLATKDYMTSYFSTKNNLFMTGEYIRDCAIEAIIDKYN